MIMGKVKSKSVIKKRKDVDDLGVIYDPKLDNVKITFTSNKLEEANKVLKNIKLPEFDSDGNPIL